VLSLIECSVYRLKKFCLIARTNIGVGPRGCVLISVLWKGSVLIDIWLAKKFL
jgi:hypothetical protein